MLTYLVHTQYKISRDQQVCVHGFGSYSEVHNLHVINRIEMNLIFSDVNIPLAHTMRSSEIRKCVCTGSDLIQKCIFYMLLIELRNILTFADVNIPRAYTV